jgi:putative aldouronate transport system permease protein
MTTMTVKPMNMKKKPRSRNMVQKSLYLMILPAVVLIGIYSYGPLMGWSIAFQNFNFAKGLFGSKWVGLANFQFIFSLLEFQRALFNSFFIASMKLVVGTAVPVAVSLMLNEMRWIGGKRAILTTIYLPHFISWLMISGIISDILSPSTGIINVVIKALGGNSVMFLANKALFPYVLVATDVWKEFGFGTIIYLSTLTSIDPNLYEAASIDGAGRFRRMWNITMPGLLPIIALLTTLNLGNILNAGFDQVVTLYSPLVYESGDILDTLVFRIGLGSGQSSIPQYDIATAVGMFQSLVSFTLVSVTYYLAYRFGDYRIF